MSSNIFSTIITLAVFFSSAFGAMQLPPIDLGLASPYAILAGSTCTSTGVTGTIITGNLGVAPGTAVSGFPPAIINGDIELANGAAGGAQGALTVAYNIAAGLPSNKTLSTLDLGGMVLSSDVYKYSGAAAMNGVLTLDAKGDASSVWVFQIESSLTVAEGSSVIFKDGVGNPDYVYWQVGSSATLGAGVPMIGNILAFSAITANYGASLNGRMLARNAAVTLDNNIINMPTTVSFSATQTVSGISLDQYNNDPDLNSITLKQAIAQTMAGVIASNVLNFNALVGPSSAAVTMSLRTAVAARALSTDSIILNYDVAVSSTMTAEELQAQLNEAVNDGSFNDYLHAAATDNGASDLSGATSDTIETQTIDTTADSSSDSSSSTLSGGAIAGIVIGGVVGLVLIALIIYYFTCHAAGHQASAVPK